MDQVKKFFEVVRKFCSPTAQKRAHPPEGNLPSPSQPDLELDQDMLLDLDMAPLEERENCEEAQRIFDQGLVHSPHYFSLSPPPPPPPFLISYPPPPPPPHYIGPPLALKARAREEQPKYFPYPSRSDFKVAQLKRRAKLKRFQLDAVLDTFLDDGFDVGELVVTKSKDLEALEQNLSGREVALLSFSFFFLLPPFFSKLLSLADLCEDVISS